MRFPAVLLVAASIAAAQTSSTRPEDLCAVGGQIVNAVTNEPLRRATIILMRADSSPGEPARSYTVSSDAGGAFALKNVEPGSYRLSVHRNGYVPYAYGSHGMQRPGTTLTLLRQQRLTDLVLKLTPQGVLTGRIVDAEGEPVENARLALQSYRYVQGRKQLTMSGGGGSTNDLGEYRIFGVAPGKYYLSVTPMPMGPGFASDGATSAGPDEDYVTTYYPGAVDPSAATQVEVAAGAQLRGLDMVLSKTRTAHVKGRVIHGMAGRPNVQVTLVPRNSAPYAGVLRNSVLDPSGNFDLRNVVPGAYVLTAIVNDGTTVRQGRLPVEVGAAGVEGLTVTIGPGVSVKGRLRPDSDAGSLDLSSARVMLQPRDQNVFMGGQVKADAEGRFEIKDVPADRYTLAIFGLPPNAFVKSARTEDVDLLAVGVDLTHGAPGGIDVVISPRAATLTGTVEDAKTGSPAAGAMVVLIPQAKERLEQAAYYRNTWTDQQGAFTLNGIAPGEYKMYAWEEVEIGAYMDPEFLKPVEGKGEAVTVREGDRQSVKLKMIPADSPGGN